MAQDDVTKRIHVVAAAAAAPDFVWHDTTKHVQLIQWVDDNGDIADGSNLILTIDGVAIEATLSQAADSLLAGAVVWEMSFPNGFQIDSLLVGTMSHGQVYIFFK